MYLKKELSPESFIFNHIYSNIFIKVYIYNHGDRDLCHIKGK